MIHLNPHEPDTDMQDYVRCVYCDRASLVLVASDVCPFCGAYGHLVWMDDVLTDSFQPSEGDRQLLNLDGGAYRAQSNISSFKNRYEDIPWVSIPDFDSASQ